MSYTWLVGIQITLSVWQKRRCVLIHSSTLCGLLPSTLLMWSPCGCVVRWWTCHEVFDLSSSLLLQRRLGRSPGASSAFAPLVGSPLLRSDARTMQGEGVLVRLGTSCENSKQLSGLISATRPLRRAPAKEVPSLSFKDLCCHSICLLTATCNRSGRSGGGTLQAGEL